MIETSVQVHPNTRPLFTPALFCHEGTSPAACTPLCSRQEPVLDREEARPRRVAHGPQLARAASVDGAYRHAPQPCAAPCKANEDLGLDLVPTRGQFQPAQRVAAYQAEP